jgi:hypothetical protein
MYHPRVAHSPFSAAFTPGARFAQHAADPIVMQVLRAGELRVPTGWLSVADPFTTDFADPYTPFARQAPTGSFPVELALARFERDARVACARVRFAPPDVPAVRWEMASFADQPALPADEVACYGVDAGTGCFFDVAARGPVDDETAKAWLAAFDLDGQPTWGSHVADVGPANVVMFSSGWGDGFYTSYWGLDAADRVVELVTDFEVLLEPVSERVAIPLPLPRGKLAHPLLAAHKVTLRAPLLSRTTAILGGPGSARVDLSDDSPVTMQHHGDDRHYTWTQADPGVQLVVSILVGIRPLAPL